MENNGYDQQANNGQDIESFSGVESLVKDSVSVLLRKYRKFGEVLSHMDIVPSSAIPTAATDGKKIYYNPRFFYSLTKRQREFILAHEIFHELLGHIRRSKGKNLELWNIATDAVINANLVHDNLDPIEGVVMIPEALTLSAEEMYERLLREQERQEQQKSLSNEQQQGKQGNENSGNQQREQSQSNSGNQQGEQSQSNSGNQQGEQSQSNSENSNESGEGQNSSSSNGKDNSQSGGQSDKQQKGNGSSIDIDDLKGRSTHDMWESACEQQQDQDNQGEEDEKKVFSEAREQRKKEAKRTQEERAKAMARVSSTHSTKLSGVGKAEKTLNWKDLIRRSLGEKTTYDYRLSRRVRYGVLPYELKKSTPGRETEVLIDASGSVSTDLVKAFLRQIKSLLRISKVRVGFFNAKFWGFVDIRTERDIDEIEIPSDMDYIWTEDWDLAVRSFSKDKGVNKIVFTDGIPGPRIYA